MNFRSVLCLDDYPDMGREDPLDTSSRVVKHFHFEEELIYARIREPNVPGAEANQQVDGMVKLVRLNIRQAREGVALVSEALRLSWQLALLVLQLQVRRDLPIVVAAVRNRHKLVATSLIFHVGVPRRSDDWNRHHGLAENVLVSINEVPNSDGRNYLVFSLSST